MLQLFRKKVSKRSVTQPFNGIRAIQAHLVQKSRVEDYVNGNSKVKVDELMSCHSSCALGKWLHDDGGALKNKALLDALQRNCEEFQAAAVQAMLLADMDKPDLAKAAIQHGQLFHDASDRFQQCLAELHIESQANH
ncbi:MAG: CZB domain-containing protein [Nitrosomonadales bacterium]|nr:CZB domain-containing protein [Nitrosomonadales bacterium]